MADTTQGIHIVTDPKGTGWVTEAGGVVKTRHRSKGAAVKKGRANAKRHGEILTIHRRDGAVISSQTYAVAPLE
jgi:hypothetical protein